MADTYHIRIKKAYAVAVIEDLQKLDAVELLNATEDFNIPKWQIDLGREEIKKILENPSLLMDWEQAKKELKL